MLEVLLSAWIIMAIFVIFERRLYRIVVYFTIYSLITSVCYLILGAPDIAIAEAAISAFVIIFFIVCIEHLYDSEREPSTNDFSGSAKRVLQIVLAVLFTAGLFFMFIHFMPDVVGVAYLYEQYMLRFMQDVGGQNAVNAILAGYRVYDTLFEALILVISVLAVAHFSWTDDMSLLDKRKSQVRKSNLAAYIVRWICPLLLIFGTYLIMNGHISAGGGFQGGLVIASFFICRYFLYGISDIPIQKVLRLEELIFINMIIVAIIAVFLGALAYLPPQYIGVYQELYLTMMNILIGLKVACGFFILFYRYIAIERVTHRM